jgi:hypothetical protein
MDERYGVRKGQSVRSLDGEDLGRVAELYDWGFAVQKGFPILFRQDTVVRYDEVRGERDGAVVVARSSTDLLDLAAGEIPPSWRVPVPHGFPAAATPSEAREIHAAVAAWPVARIRPGDAPATPAQPPGSPLEPSQAVQARAAAGEDDALAPGEEARSVESHGQARPSLIWQREDADRHAP